MKLVLSEFGGMFPVRGTRGTPPHVADYVLDADLSRGSLRPWRTNKLLSSAANATVLYEVDGCCVLSTQICASFAQGNPSPTCAETVYRTAPNSTPVMATQQQACANDWRPLSFPDFPAPTVVAPAVPDDERREDVYVVYTVVDDLGRESAPSDPSQMLVTNFGSPLLISGFPTSYPHGAFIRIYLSRPSWTSGEELAPTEELSGFFLMQELDIGPASTIAVVDYPGPACTTIDYQPAPDNLTNITDFRGSQLLGLSNNMLVASIRNTFHAWPSRLSVRFHGNARTVLSGKTMAYVLTDEAPMVVLVPSGCGGMDAFKCEQLRVALPCVSARGAAMHGDTVIYPSKDGLVAMSGSQWLYLPQWDKRSWQAMRPDQMIGVVHNNCYFGSTSAGTFRLDLKAEPTRALTWVSFKPTAMYSGTTQRLVYSDATGIHSWGQGPDLQTAVWRRSNGFMTGLGALSAAKAYGLGSFNVQLWADNARLANVTTLQSGKAARISPVRAREFGVEVSTTGELESLIIGGGEDI